MTGISSAFSWHGRVALVTGCTGLLGCWVSRRLCDLGARVVGLVRDAVTDGHPFERFGLRDRMKLVTGSVDDFDLVRRLVAEERVQVILHLAGQSRVHVAAERPRLAFEVNIRGTWNVLEAVRVAGTRTPVVLASSGTVYGTADELPFTEDTPLRSTSPYDASKACAESVARSYHATFGVPVCLVRSGNLYGGGDLHIERIVPGTIRALLSGERPVIQGDGRAVRDYLYVDDAARAYVMLAEATDDSEIAGEAFNLGAERPTTVADIVETIMRVGGRPDLTAHVLGRPAPAVPAMVLSSLKARKAVGWRAETPLETGLASTIAWYREFWRPAPPRALPREAGSGVSR
jgi:CDP-glucose 4,6-dehydratase